jgi:biopolymer transport protein ExbD
MTHRKDNREQEDVELNVTAMLDMAFQLLAFFILTFSPPLLESEFWLRLPPPKPIASDRPIFPRPAGGALPAMKTLNISASADKEGRLELLGVGEQRVGGLSELDARLRTIFHDPASPFEQVLLQVGPGLHYEDLLEVVAVCAKQTLADGRKLSKLSFADASAVQ